MDARLGLDDGGRRAPVLEQLGQGSGVGDAGPRVEATHQVWAFGNDRDPERAGCRLEQLSSPHRDRQYASWAYQPPQLGDGGSHVGQEEEPEDADNRVERLRWQSAVLDISR